MRQYSLVCDDPTAEQIEGLAAEYALSEQEVIEQLVGLGLEELD